ncbi:hypothetical protein AMECASPLE_031873 [Ameca splendens]|uniref:Uncharacterized protein n=1 Tax=Ameca splendens TaxID=208324 RepID=A0ABV0ZU61_9TELE
MPSLRAAADSDKVISSESVQQQEMGADYPPLRDLGVLLSHQRASQKVGTGERGNMRQLTFVSLCPRYPYEGVGNSTSNPQLTQQQMARSCLLCFNSQVCLCEQQTLN